MASLPSSRTAPALRRTATAHAACLSLALAAGAAVPLAAHAQASPNPPAATAATAVRSFQVPAGPLGAALTAFAADAGVSISAPPALVQGKRTPGLQGRYAVGEGLARLLAGSDLQAQAAGPGSYVLRAVPEASRQGAAGPGGATLAEVRVTAEAERSGSTEGSGSYTSTGPSTTAAGLALALRETPQSVSILTRQRLDDEGIASVETALDRAPGISVQNIGSSRYSVNSRGYAIDSYQLDGIVTATDIVSQNIPQSQADLAIYDRIEVLRGAAGLLVGAGDPSGTINLVRKKPTRAFQGSASLGLGSWSRKRAELDVAGPLNDSGSVRGRFVGAHERGDTHVDYAKTDKSVIYGVLEADLSPSTVLTVGLDHQRNAPRGTSASGLPLFDSTGAQTDYAASANAAARWNSNRITATNTFASLEHQWANEWRLKASGNHMRGRRSSTSADASWGFPDPAVGDVQLYGGLARAQQRQTGLDVQLQGPFELLGRRHEAVVGMNWSEFENLHQSLNAYDEVEGRTVNLPTWQNQTAIPVADGSKYMDYNGWQKQYGAYGALRFKPRDDLAVIVGTRISNYRYSLTEIYPAMPSWNDVTQRSASGVVAPYAGIVYDLDGTHSVYASYTSIFKPQSVRDRTGAVLDPREGDNYELGLKSAFLGGRLNSAIALYEIRQDNLAEPDAGQTVPGTQNEAAYRAVQGAKTRGVDLEITGELLRHWQVGASYNYSTTQDAQGTRINTVFPRQMAKLWTSYRLSGALRGLTLGGGVNWQDRIYFTATPWQLPGQTLTGQQKAYAVVNLMARYEFSPQLSATVNLNNVFDKKYLQGLDTTFYTGYYAATRNAMLSLKYTF